MIDINKEYMTVGGDEVRLYANDGGGDFSIHGAVKNKVGWMINWWTSNGKYCFNGDPSDFDLIEKSIAYSFWINFYEHLDGTIGCGRTYDTEKLARMNITETSSRRYINTVKVETTEARK